jgi:hypothetical protein
MRPKLDPKRVAAILSEAEIAGDKITAKRYGITERTIQRYRTLVPASAELSHEIEKNQKIAARELGNEMLRALRVGVAKLEELIAAAKPGDHRVLFEVAGAVKILTDAQTLREVVHGQQPERPKPDSHPSAPPGRAPAEGPTDGAAPVH